MDDRKGYRLSLFFNPGNNAVGVNFSFCVWFKVLLFSVIST
jgi:hypothetical protein